MHIFNISPVSVPLDDIDASGRYRISKSRPSAELYRSVRDFGVLEPPVLVRNRDTLAIVIGHNRIAAARGAGAGSVHARIAEKIEPGWYRPLVLLKAWRGELGPAGRVRALSILRKECGVGDDDIIDIARSGLSVPGDFAAGDAAERLLKLPQSLVEYCDNRDIPFRVMDKVINMPPEMSSLLGGWVEKIDFTVNHFKMVTDMLIDMVQRGDSSESLRKIEFDRDNTKKGEEEILRALYEKRYPEYTSLSQKAAALQRALESKGLAVELPRYFEGGAVTVRLDVRKSADQAELRERVEAVMSREMRELLELL